MGSGPVLVLVHGTGAATHSWRALAPLLAQRFDVVAFDLPGHGFTDMLPPREMSLTGMARAVSALLTALDARPMIGIGHSAGAAILARMQLDRRLDVRLFVSLAGALLPLQGWAGQLFSPMAKLLAATPLVPRLFSRYAADPEALDRLIDGTGSRVDAAGVALYGRLVRNRHHAGAALSMMANWDLHTLARDLPGLTLSPVLVTGANDRAIPPGEAERVRQRVRGARVVILEKGGHLVHEEAPECVAAIVLKAWEDAAGVAQVST